MTSPSSPVRTSAGPAWGCLRHASSIGRRHGSAVVPLLDRADRSARGLPREGGDPRALTEPACWGRTMSVARRSGRRPGPAGVAADDRPPPSTGPRVRLLLARCPRRRGTRRRADRGLVHNSSVNWPLPQAAAAAAWADADAWPDRSAGRDRAWAITYDHVTRREGLRFINDARGGARAPSAAASARAGGAVRPRPRAWPAGSSSFRCACRFPRTCVTSARSRPQRTTSGGARPTTTNDDPWCSSA